jgi:hypothetical protein
MHCITLPIQRIKQLKIGVSRAIIVHSLLSSSSFFNRLLIAAFISASSGIVRPGLANTPLTCTTEDFGNSSIGVNAIPVAVTLMTNSVPEDKCKSSRIALGITICPLLDNLTVPISCPNFAKSNKLTAYCPVFKLEVIRLAPDYLLFISEYAAQIVSILVSVKQIMKQQSN